MTDTLSTELEFEITRSENLERELDILKEDFYALECKEVEMISELAALRKAIEDRRTVEGWVLAGNERGALLERNGDTVLVSLVPRFMSQVMREQQMQGDHYRRATPDEAYSAAAEWVRGQG